MGRVNWKRRMGIGRGRGERKGRGERGRVKGG